MLNFFTILVAGDLLHQMEDMSRLLDGIVPVEAQLGHAAY